MVSPTFSYEQEPFLSLWARPQVGKCSMKIPTTWASMEVEGVWLWMRVKVLCGVPGKLFGIQWRPILETKKGFLPPLHMPWEWWTHNGQSHLFVMHW